MLPIHIIQQIYYMTDPISRVNMIMEFALADTGYDMSKDLKHILNMDETLTVIGNAKDYVTKASKEYEERLCEFLLSYLLHHNLLKYGNRSIEDLKKLLAYAIIESDVDYADAPRTETYEVVLTAPQHNFFKKQPQLVHQYLVENFDESLITNQMVRRVADERNMDYTAEEFIENFQTKKARNRRYHVLHPDFRI
jgi:hypothetical protein